MACACIETTPQGAGRENLGGLDLVRAASKTQAMAISSEPDLQTRPYLFDDFLKAGLPHP
jgi:hypothetical protein